MKTVEERMVEVEAAIQKQPVTGCAYVRDVVAKHLTQQAAEWQIAMKEAVDKEAKEYKETCCRLRADNSLISCERHESRVENQRLKAVLSQFQNGERGFLAASCKECGAALQPEDIMGAIRHKGMCPNAARQHCWQTGPLPIMVNNWDDLTSPAKVASDGWWKFCEAQGKPANVQETLDRALGRLDEVEAKLKLVIGMVLDEDRRRL